ncbi:MAG: ABC transporter permease, partial [Phycisphaerae bacterium]
MVTSLWKYRTLILRNAVNDLRNRYSGSLAGYLWNVFIPLAQILVFATVFGVLMMQRLPESPLRDSRWAYVVYLCTGLLPWNAFADTLNRGVSSLVSNAGYLKKLALPEQIFVAQDACAGFLTGLVSLGVFAAFAAAVAGHYPTWAWLQALPALVLLVGFAYGLGLLFSCVNVFYRDVQPLMNIVLMLWFWVTP